MAVLGAGAGLLGLLLPLTACANIGSKWLGDPVAEPPGVKDVAITHEDLTIDLRPVAALQPVRVDVVYHVHNPSTTKKLDLIFVSGTADVSDFEVRLDDLPVESRRVPWDEVPGGRTSAPWTWNPEQSAPGIENESYYTLWYKHALALLAFSIELPPGPGTLTVHYRARACGADECLPSHPTTTWQFPYVLSPAREWGSFGGLDVLVYVPAGWQSSSSPALEREEDVLRGHFGDLPSDVLRVATRAPVPPALHRANAVYLGQCALVMVGGGVLCWWAGSWLGRFLARKAGRGEHVAHRGSITLAAIILPLLWAGLIVGAARLAMLGMVASLGGQESPSFHYRFDVLGCFTFFQMLLALPVGFLLTWGSACRRLGRAAQVRGRPAG
jgi:hypothetical protein